MIQTVFSFLVCMMPIITTECFQTTTITAWTWTDTPVPTTPLNMIHDAEMVSGWTRRSPLAAVLSAPDLGIILEYSFIPVWYLVWRLINVTGAGYADCNGLYTISNETGIWDNKRIVYERVVGGWRPMDKRWAQTLRAIIVETTGNCDVQIYLLERSLLWREFLRLEYRWLPVSCGERTLPFPRSYRSFKPTLAGILESQRLRGTRHLQPNREQGSNQVATTPGLNL